MLPTPAGLWIALEVGPRRWRLAGSSSVSAAQDTLEQWTQGRHAATHDADVYFCGRPNSDVARIPEEVTQSAVVDDIAQLHKRSRASKDTEAENCDKCDAGSAVHVQVPQHRGWNEDGKEEIGEDVESGAGVGERLESVLVPADRFDRRVPLNSDIRTLREHRLQAKTINK